MSRSNVTYAQNRDAFKAALQQHGESKTYKQYGEMFSVTGRQIKSWRTDLINEFRIYFPEPCADNAKQGYRRPQVNPRGEITISANAFNKHGIRIPYGAMLEIEYEEKPGDSNCLYKGSRIILTFNGKIGKSGDEEAADIQRFSLADMGMAMPYWDETAVLASEQTPVNGATVQ